MVRISEAASLGLHTMALLARPGQKRSTNQEIAEILGASVHHLAKVMQRLVRAKLVDSAVGPQGGFRLAHAARRIKLLEIYEAIEGPMGEPGCLLATRICEGNDCVLGELVQRLNAEIRRYLVRTTLAVMVESIALIKSLDASCVTCTGGKGRDR